MYLHIKISLFSAAATLVLGKGHLVTLSNEKKKFYQLDIGECVWPWKRMWRLLLKLCNKVLVLS